MFESKKHKVYFNEKIIHTRLNCLMFLEENRKKRRNPLTKLLTLLLLSTTYPVLANSVDPDQLASELDLHCLSLNMWISIKNSDQVIWLAEN